MKAAAAQENQRRDPVTVQNLQRPVEDRLLQGERSCWIQPRRWGKIEIVVFKILLLWKQLMIY